MKYEIKILHLDSSFYTIRMTQLHKFSIFNRNLNKKPSSSKSKPALIQIPFSALVHSPKLCSKLQQTSYTMHAYIISVVTEAVKAFNHHITHKHYTDKTTLEPYRCLMRRTSHVVITVLHSILHKMFFTLKHNAWQQ